MKHKLKYLLSLRFKYLDTQYVYFKVACSEKSFLPKTLTFHFGGVPCQLQKLYICWLKALQFKIFGLKVRWKVINLRSIVKKLIKDSDFMKNLVSLTL
jgi:hypothetical protein